MPPAESVGRTGPERSKLRIRQRQGHDALNPILRQNCGTWVSGSEGDPGGGKWKEGAVGPGGSFLAKEGTRREEKREGVRRGGRWWGAGILTRRAAPRRTARVARLGRTGPVLYKRSPSDPRLTCSSQAGARRFPWASAETYPFPACRARYPRPVRSAA